MRLATVLSLACFVCPAFAQEPSLGSVSLGYTHGLGGAVSVDGKSHDWDESARYALILRNWYRGDDGLFPFSELTLFLDDATADVASIEVEAQTFALGFAVGAAKTFYRAPARDLSFVVAPYLGLHAGRLSIDLRQDPSHHSDDDSFRWGLDAGLDVGVLINRAFSVTLGLAGSYWRAYDADLSVTDGVTESRIESDPSGWDLGARLTAGLCF